jgi:hypothetical protein
MNFDKIREILVTRHGFSEERINSQIERLEGLKRAKQQKSLDKWF